MDFAALQHDFHSACARRMSAPGGRTQETMRSNGNIKVEYEYSAPNIQGPNTYPIPAFSFTEMILS